MEADDPVLDKELRRDEGVRYSPYKDTEDILTVGVGHNLIAKPLGLIYPLHEAEVTDILVSDIKGVFEALDQAIPWWRTLSYVRQRVVVNMCFNLGINRFLGFKKMLAFLKAGQYTLAANEMLNSKWATQVGNRAKRLYAMMLKG